MPHGFWGCHFAKELQLSLENFTRGCQIPRDVISSVTPACIYYGLVLTPGV